MDNLTDIRALTFLTNKKSSINLTLDYLESLKNISEEIDNEAYMYLKKDILNNDNSFQITLHEENYIKNLEKKKF